MNIFEGISIDDIVKQNVLSYIELDVCLNFVVIKI